MYLSMLKDCDALREGVLGTLETNWLDIYLYNLYLHKYYKDFLSVYVSIITKVLHTS